MVTQIVLNLNKIGAYSMAVNTLLNKISTELKEKVSEFEVCEKTFSDFENLDFKTYSFKPPCLYISCSGAGIGENTGTGEIDIPLLINAYIITSGSNHKKADEKNLELIEKVILSLADNSFHLENVHYPEQVSFSHFRSVAKDSQKISIKKIKWQQKIRIGTDAFKTPYPSPSILYTGLSPAIGIGHKQDYLKKEFAK